MVVVSSPEAPQKGAEFATTFVSTPPKFVHADDWHAVFWVFDPLELSTEQNVPVQAVFWVFEPPKAELKQKDVPLQAKLTVFESPPTEARQPEPLLQAKLTVFRLPAATTLEQPESAQLVSWVLEVSCAKLKQLEPLQLLFWVFKKPFAKLSQMEVLQLLFWLFGLSNSVLLQVEVASQLSAAYTLNVLVNPWEVTATNIKLPKTNTAQRKKTLLLPI
jgi:hypothetical protein